MQFHAAKRGQESKNFLSSSEKDGHVGGGGTSIE